MDSMLKAGLVVLSLSFSGLIANASSSQDLENLIGKYKGSSPVWSREESTCEIDISVLKNELIVTLVDSEGIRFAKRSAQDPSKFESVLLKSLSFPAVSIRQLSRENSIEPGRLSHVIQTSTFKTQTIWTLSARNLDQDGSGYVNINYRKNKRWEPYNSTLEYVPDMTGCYNLSKVR